MFLISLHHSLRNLTVIEIPAISRNQISVLVEWFVLGFGMGIFLHRWGDVCKNGSLEVCEFVKMCKSFRFLIWGNLRN